jgi:hypothetical protein
MKWLLLASFLLGQTPRSPVDGIVEVGGVIYPGVTVTGTIVTEDGRRFPLFLPSLYIYIENGTGMRKILLGPDGVKIKGTGTFGSIPVSKGGNFTLPLPDGEYRIALITSSGQPLSASDGYYVKSMSSGSVDLLKEPLKVDRTHPPSITIVLAAVP